MILSGGRHGQISALHSEFQDSQGYRVRSCLTSMTSKVMKRMGRTGRKDRPGSHIPKNPRSLASSTVQPVNSLRGNETCFYSRKKQMSQGCRSWGKNEGRGRGF